MPLVTERDEMVHFFFFLEGDGGRGARQTIQVEPAMSKRGSRTGARKDLISPESKSLVFFQKKRPKWKVCLPEEKFEISGCALLSGDKPPRPQASGCPQVHLRAKLQQIGRTVCGAGHLAPFTRRSIGRDSLTLSLTHALGAYCKNNLHLIQSHIPPSNCLPKFDSIEGSAALPSVRHPELQFERKGLEVICFIVLLERGSVLTEI